METIEKVVQGRVGGLPLLLLVVVRAAEDPAEAVKGEQHHLRALVVQPRDLGTGRGKLWYIPIRYHSFYSVHLYIALNFLYAKSHK